MKLIVLLFASAMAGIALAPPASAGAPTGCLVDRRGGSRSDLRLRGNNVWLDSLAAVPARSGGQTQARQEKPRLALRQRELCGMNVIWNLRPTGPDHWDGGRFYNPDSGKTHDLKMGLTASDALEARFYEGASFLGETKDAQSGSTRHIERLVLSWH